MQKQHMIWRKTCLIYGKWSEFHCQTEQTNATCLPTTNLSHHLLRVSGHLSHCDSKPGYDDWWRGADKKDSLSLRTRSPPTQKKCRCDETGISDFKHTLMRVHKVFPQGCGNTEMCGEKKTNLHVSHPSIQDHKSQAWKGNCFFLPSNAGSIFVTGAKGHLLEMNIWYSSLPAICSPHEQPKAMLALNN